VEGRLNPAKARKSPRFDAFAQEYLEWVKANKKPLTYVRVSVIIRRELIPFFGTTKLSEVTPWQIEQFKKAQKDTEKAPATINLALTFLRALLYKAKAWGNLAETPFRDVKLLKNPREKTRFLSEEEEGAILTVCSPPLRRMVEAGTLTGFRRQELTSLRPEDVDFQRAVVSVASCYAKNGESRTLPIGPRLRTILQGAIQDRGDVPTVFVTEKGRPWIPNTFRVAFSKACEMAGLTPLSPHVLRHTFASRLVMAGVDLRTVQELMGHKTIAMTLRYAHLSPDHKRAAIETLESRFSAKIPANIPNTPVAPLLDKGIQLVAGR
jgi:integrase